MLFDNPDAREGVNRSGGDSPQAFGIHRYAVVQHRQEEATCVVRFVEESIVYERESSSVQLPGSNPLGIVECGFGEAVVSEEAGNVCLTVESGGPWRRRELVQFCRVIVGVLCCESMTLPSLSRSVAVASISAGPSSKSPVVA